MQDEYFFEKRIPSKADKLRQSQYGRYKITIGNSRRISQYNKEILRVETKYISFANLRMAGLLERKLEEELERKARKKKEMERRDSGSIKPNYLNGKKTYSPRHNSYCSKKR